MYSIVETEDKYFTIPSAWIFGDGTKFYYPLKAAGRSRADAIKNRIEPEPEKNWTVYDILQIYDQFDDYQNARARCIKIVNARNNLVEGSDAVGSKKTKPSYEDVVVNLLNKAIKQQTHINERLSKAESFLDKFNAKNPEEKLELNLVSNFPLTLKHLNVFEEKLRKSKYAVALIKWMEKRGGVTHQKMLKLILQDMISLELAAVYSWTGKATGSKPFQDLRVTKCMIKAVQKMYETAEGPIGAYISEWLAQAKIKRNKRQKT